MSLLLLPVSLLSASSFPLVLRQSQKVEALWNCHKSGSCSGEECIDAWMETYGRPSYELDKDD
jgi:hypothetical protein